MASSTWTTNMLRLDPSFNADLPESKRWLKEFGARENEAFRKYPVPGTEKERRRALDTATKFLVVRHPMDRLVSSYLDKVRDYTDIFSFLGSHVHFVGRFQVADTSKEPNLLKHRDVKNAILESAGKKAELGTVPTFPEFVDYVVAETRDLASPRDWKGVMTWKSYYAKCLPCDVRYDGKYLSTKIYLTTKNLLQQEN